MLLAAPSLSARKNLDAMPHDFQLLVEYWIEVFLFAHPLAKCAFVVTHIGGWLF